MIFSKDCVLSFFSYKDRNINIYKTNVLLYDIENKGEERWRTEQREREEK